MKFTALLGMAAALAVGGTGMASAQTAAPAQLDSKKFNVIGTWNFLNINKKVEAPFWSEQLGAASGGKLTGNIDPQSALSGGNGLRQMIVIRRVESRGQKANHHPVNFRGIDGLTRIEQEVRELLPIRHVFEGA